MRYLREILRLRHAGGLSQREIARSLSIGLGTVCECLGRAAEASLGWPLPADFDDARLETLLAAQPSHTAPPSRPLPDLARIHTERRPVPPRGASSPRSSGAALIPNRATARAWASCASPSVTARRA